MKRGVTRIRSGVPPLKRAGTLPECNLSPLIRYAITTGNDANAIIYTRLVCLDRDGWVSGKIEGILKSACERKEDLYVLFIC